MFGILLLLAASIGGGDPLTPAYDRLEHAYSPYMPMTEPAGFPMKLRAIAGDEYKFWRGSKDLFFQWSQDACADWLADPQSYLVAHGDLHLGNIGSYPAQGANRFVELGFGMVDFDDAAKMPAQLELLQGYITLRLIASQNGITLADDRRAALIAALLDSYLLALADNRTAAAMLFGESPVRELLARRDGVGYEDEIRRLTDARGRFRPAIVVDGKLQEVLASLPADEFDAIAIGVSQAIANRPELKALFKIHTSESIRGAIRDVAVRTRLGSSGSQGLRKILVLLDRPFNGLDCDAVIYLKEQIPAAAERSDAVPRDSRTPGERASEAMRTLTDPQVLINSWCEIGARSYWVGLKEPWSDELSASPVRSWDELRASARVWGIVAGSGHRSQPAAKRLLAADRDKLVAQLRDRGEAYLLVLRQDFDSLTNDPRTRQRVAEAEAFLSSARRAQRAP